MKITKSKKKEIRSILGDNIKFLSKKEQHRKNSKMMPVSRIKTGKHKPVPNGSNRFVYQSCSKKCRYRTHAEASIKAQKVMRELGIKMRIYACDICGGFHLTKMS